MVSRNFITRPGSQFVQSGTGAVERTVGDKLQDVVSVLDFGADPTGGSDSHAAITAAIASGAAEVYFPKGTYSVSQPIVMNRQGLRLRGANQTDSVINQTAGFSGVATVDVNGARLQTISDLFIGGNFANGSDVLRITNGQLFCGNNLTLKTGVAGIRYISGNCIRIYNVFAESNQTGFLVVPDAGDNTNGATISGFRAYNSSSWGIDIQQGAAVNGHMHSTWDASAEAGENGIRVRGGRYCNYNFYTEANTTDDFDLDNAVANYYFLKNPDNDTTGAGVPNFGYSAGWRSSGGNIFLDRGLAPERYFERDFPISGSLGELGVTMWDITNSSGGTRGLTLSFLSYSPVGFRCTVTKRDNTPGFILSAPAGINLTGDTGNFGAFANPILMMEIMKINATTAVIRQY